MGESLWYFLVRFRDPTAGEPKDQLETLLAQAGVRYACEYTLYGFWDGLLRVWLRGDAKRRLLQMIKARADELGMDDVRYFEVSGLYYMWHLVDVDLLGEGAGPSLEKLHGFEDKVHLAKGDSGALPAKVQDELRRNELLIERPPWRSGGIKLYLALEHTATTSLSQELQVQFVRDAVQETGLAERCSLYAGDGFARFLIRCEADDFDSIRLLTERIYVQLRGLYKKGLALRPMAFVIIEASVESDNLNVFDSLSLRDEDTVKRLDLTDGGRVRFGAMEQGERDHMHELVLSVDKLSLDDARLSDTLVGLLRACVEEDYAEVMSSLSFVIDFEWLFREFMIRVWARCYGGDWREALADRLEEFAPEEGLGDLVREKGPGEWSFGTLHKLAEVSGRADAEVQEHLASEIGADWHGQLYALIDLRNYAAHGKVRSVERLGRLEGKWGERVEEAIKSAEMYFRLDNLLRRKEMTDDAQAHVRSVG